VRLLYAELLKIRTAPWTTVILVLSLIAITVLGAGSTLATADDIFGSPDVVGDVVSISQIALVFGLLFGILIVTWDYRHGTITQTFLAAPRRERVVLAKLATAVLVGVTLVLLALAIGIVMGKAWLGGDFVIVRENWEEMGRVVTAGALWAMFGAGVGAILQTQVGALVSSLIWFLVVEPIVMGLRPRIGTYLPGNALDAFVSGSDRLSRGNAASVAAAYAVVAAAIGTASVLRRDVS
jgi:ABC-2 type transport system permease protein